MHTQQWTSSCLLLLGRFLLVGLGKPFEERSSSLSDLLGDGHIGVLLAGLGAPLEDDLLVDQIVVVVQLQDLDDLRVRIRVVLGKSTEQALSASEEGPLMAFRSDDLGNISDFMFQIRVCARLRLTCLSMLARLGI